MPSSSDTETSTTRRLERLANDAIAVAKKASKHRQNLAGAGFYANKLSELRILATNTFAELRAGTAGDTSALAELIAEVFSATTASKARAEAARELTFALRTTWRDGGQTETPAIGDAVFPMSLLEQTRRGYFITIGRQINGCFKGAFYDACSVMMRRMLEICIIELFEAKHIADKIKDATGNYFQLSDLISATLSEPSLALSRNTKRALPRLRDSGHLSAHGRGYFAQRADIERIQADFRVAVEELLRASGRL